MTWINDIRRITRQCVSPHGFDSTSSNDVNDFVGRCCRIWSAVACHIGGFDVGYWAIILRGSDGMADGYNNLSG